MDPVRYLSGLLLVGLLLAAALWMLKRSRWAGLIKSGPIQLVFQIGVGTREKLVLIRYNGNEYLLGVTPNAITKLECTPIKSIESE
jgi:flagellar biogenesis protein FliO